MTITREQIEMYASAADATQTFEMDKGKLIAVEPEHMQELARMALAGMEAEPVACIDQANLDYLKSGSDADVWPVSSSDADSVLLYSAPQPLTTSERAELENYRKEQQVVPEALAGDIDADDHPLTWSYHNGWNAYRAAMLQGKAEPVSNRDELPAKCWCHTCRPVTMNDMRFVVCPDCGNKRCPHANDHRNSCTGSNEPGQEGSAYPAAPQQEVKP